MKKTDNQALVIFGASGDLTERKLIPSVFNLFCGGFLPENYAVVGVSRSVYTDEEYRQKVVFENEHLKNKKAATPEKLKAFAELVFYQSVNTKEISAYSALKERLDQLDKQKSCANNYIFYLATPPSLYQTIAKGLADSGLNNQENGWSRLIVEKPFGYDLDSAKKLNKDLLSNFVEEQIYRIDHYLGKETVQNMFVTRFANSIFEPLWNRNYIHRIEVTAAEHVGGPTPAGRGAQTSQTYREN